jgi:hypothetical protein
VPPSSALFDGEAQGQRTGVGCRCFLHRQDIGLSRSRVPALRWSCKLGRTTKHTIVYPDSGPIYRVIALHPTFLILKMNNATMGVSRELRKFTK